MAIDCGTNRGKWGCILLVFTSCCLCLHSALAEDPLALAQFQQQIKPILEEKCFDCHAYGMQEGSVAFDGFESDEALIAKPELWYRALRMLRSGLMPPAEMPPLSGEEMQQVEAWIKSSVFHGDPQNPDPGHVTLRRLNRVEYRNTIRDLFGVEYDVQENFPQDDSGHGFDNLGEVLTVSPLLLEKYLAAAREIVSKAVPKEATPGSEEFFPRPIPKGASARRAYARGILSKFASRAYRRPVDSNTTEGLALLAESVYSQPGGTFEGGVAEAMAAVLTSPRFLFREDFTERTSENSDYAELDDYSLATRLSYFLWSTMPDEELFQLAAENKLRENLPAQLERMLKSGKAIELTRNFAGQWLRSRDIEYVIINGPEVIRHDISPDVDLDKKRKRFRHLRRIPDADMTVVEREELEKIREEFIKFKQHFESYELNRDLRHAMRQETELVFETIVREDRSVLELLESDYTFLNERLAKHYGIEGVKGDEMQRVVLPEGSLRGGILTQGTMLAVTSNPDRTSPVKRGLYILDNILGTPPPPPPPNIPDLEDAGSGGEKRVFTVAEALAVHRAEPLCSSCHNRMDPLGLALEQFNALGIIRETDHGKPVVTAGELITGEQFTDIRELKRILATEHRQEFYRCLTEKMLIYALGRGIDYHDIETIDAIVEQLESSGGRPSVLIKGIVDSAAFQKCRVAKPLVAETRGTDRAF
ncbi:DUF1592 domain-containing protein [Bythopirellula polymerisocia]|uniref:Planctomycete cytochrome C n=1 Tax=Bythopirellula polymerisocia TaxID=2528003 RepID=A0A5C6CTP9_9BACT|nr:DUF1592 domain-containing protein [Bythopirellula polymerisocia]TWU28323.1 hypothetical protein Pla144_16110 [Bythopirellula polymerisocia]